MVGTVAKPLLQTAKPFAYGVGPVAKLVKCQPCQQVAILRRIYQSRHKLLDMVVDWDRSLASFCLGIHQFKSVGLDFS